MKQMEADGLPNFAQPQSGSESDSELGAAGGPESAARYALELTAALNSEAHALAGLGVASVSALRPGGPTGVVRRWGFVQNADSGAYEPDPWTRPQGRWQVEPPVARLLELSRLGPQTALYCPSRDRQWHLYVASEKPQGGARGAALSRVFLRGVIRQISAQALVRGRRLARLRVEPLRVRGPRQRGHLPGGPRGLRRRRVRARRRGGVDLRRARRPARVRGLRAPGGPPAPA